MGAANFGGTNRAAMPHLRHSRRKGLRETRQITPKLRRVAARASQRDAPALNRTPFPITEPSIQINFRLIYNDY